MRINEANVAFEKVYWLSTYFSQDWDKAKSLCKSYDMELASLDTPVEASKFLELSKQNSALFDVTTYIGSLSTKAQSRTELFKPRVEEKENSLKVLGVEKSSEVDKRVCPALEKESKSFFFTNVVCASENIKYKFVCQSV